jgi:hypothetical protein
MNEHTHFPGWSARLRVGAVAVAVAMIVGIAIANAPLAKVPSVEPVAFDGSVIMDLNPNDKTIGGSVYTMYGSFGELGYQAYPHAPNADSYLSDFED